MNTHIEARFKGKKTKAGMYVELVGDDRIWLIESVNGEPIDPKTLNRCWNNNI